MTNFQDPNTLHTILGTLTLGVVLCMFVLAPIMEWDIPIAYAALLTFSYLVLLGFGHAASMLKS